ncbi:MAG: TIGR03790 family protein [Spartobacteria bacterium]|nr:TIGR03790 family protein [Spartobacteria bacterium]
MMREMSRCVLKTICCGLPLRLLGLAGGLLCGLNHSAYAAETGTGSVVVLANETVPASVELARYYMEKRGIPEENLCVLALSRGEIMSRATYNSKLRDPLLAFLRKQGLIQQALRDDKDIGPNQSAWITRRSSVKYLVAMYGVPLRVSDIQTMVRALTERGTGKFMDETTSAVDSELALLLAAPYDLKGPVSCPFYNVRYFPEPRADNQFFILTTRLDGPDEQTVRNMIDQSLFAERYGLLGRMYFDGRGMTDPAYRIGDDWIAEACHRFQREGYECTLDEAGGLIADDYPMQEVAGYFGWYHKHIKGPFLNDDFRFQPGAIACHIHSYSGKSLRSKSLFWMGPLLYRGAAATLGAVYEPYLAFTPNLDIFADRLCRGMTLAEAAYSSLRVVSWQISVAADPLYRPFRYSLDEQIAHLEADEIPGREWAYVRKMNLLAHSGRYASALEYGLRKVEQTDSLVLRERLGDLYALNHLDKDAGQQYAYVVEHARDALMAVRVGVKRIQLLNKQDNKEEAREVEAYLRKTWEDASALRWLETNL